MKITHTKPKTEFKIWKDVVGELLCFSGEANEVYLAFKEKGRPNRVFVMNFKTFTLCVPYADDGYEMTESLPPFVRVHKSVVHVDGFYDKT